MKTTDDQAGITFIEVMISLGIMSVTAMAAVELLADHIHHLSRQEAAVERRQEGRAALAVLVRELSAAGFPSAPDPLCHAMVDGIEVGPSSVRFLANLYGVATALTAPAAAGDTAVQIPDNARINLDGLSVSPGSAFAPNDAVYLYDPGRAEVADDDRVECHRLDRAGRSGLIPLAAGDRIRRPFPSGARLQVVNLVQYAYAPSTRQLIRTVDGGAQSVADQVASAEFGLREGRMTAKIILDSRPSLDGHSTAGAVWQTLVAMRNYSANDRE